MKRRLAAIFLTLMVGSCCRAVLAKDAVSSATVDITSVPAAAQTTWQS